MSQKDSSDEVVKDWFGQLPEGWSLRRLRTLGRFSSSGIDKKTVEGEPLVRMVNYTDVYGNSTHELRNSPDYMVVSCPANKVEEHGLVQGDMLFTPSSETAEDIGVSAVVMEDLDNTVYSYHITRFRMRDEVSLRYRKYLCNHPRVLRQFSRLCKGTTRQILVREDFKSAWVAVPPPDQHDRIAAFLDEATGKIDRLMSLRRRQMELLREQRAALIQQAVTRGLNPRAPLKDSGLPWIGQIPQHWQLLPLRGVLTERGEFNTDLRTTNFLSVLKDVGVVPYEEREASGNKKSDDLSKYKIIHPGDIVANRMNLIFGSVGLSAHFGCSSTEYYVLKARNAAIDTRFYVLIFQSKAFQRSLVGIGSGILAHRMRIYYEALKKVVLPVPPIREQQDIIAHVEKENERCDALRRSYERQLALLAEYRASLIHECVTGQRAVGEDS